MTLRILMKQPSAILPMMMSLAALVVVLTRIVIVGTAPQADEGAAAHLFQLLIGAQLPLVPCFAFRWLPKASVAALQTLVLQLGAAITALAPVFLLHL